ncbi:YlzJ-like family protein [Paenibacillus sp. HB172176]|uniref:YlzJ-like family protein n=1 Tax=Paenibacillus sp. HB172176 TaxID=2493690 RepID=UPI00143963D4|nr:YlzJ-like family protein [Paenibacillus sp. HB172176]
MTLYTAVPFELVFQGYDQEPEQLHEISTGGIRMQIVAVAPGIGRIVRLLECRLDDYLRPELAPGTLIHYSGAEERNREGQG